MLYIYLAMVDIRPHIHCTRQNMILFLNTGKQDSEISLLLIS